MQSLADMKHRNPLVIAGDLHATGVGTMHAAGNRNFDDNPITNILCGPVGTSTWGFPSVVRGVRAAPSQYLNFQEQVPPFEEHGFTIVDFEQDKIVAKLFKWDVNSQPLEAIDTLQPYYTVELDRP
jgi:phosphodiesterase/alkaline phosphatase D-like protein